MKHKEILPLVYVTKNPFDNLNEIHNFFINKNDNNLMYLSEWNDNSHKGIVSKRCGFTNAIEMQPAKNVNNKEKEVLEQIRQKRNETYNEYVELVKDNPIWNGELISLKENSDSWYRNGYDIFCHEGLPLSKSKENVYALNYHTDANFADYGQDQHVVTTMMYLNDDYEHGEIEFFFKEDGVDKVLCYKPAAGDFITFPSFFPYFHGVRAPYGGERYTIRTSVNFKFDSVVEKNKIRFSEYFGEFEDIKDRVSLENYIYVDGRSND